MKHTNHINHRASLAILIGLTCMLFLGNVQAGDTKPYKLTFTELIITHLNPGALPQPFYEQARDELGLEVWSGIVHLFTHSNVGGKGNAVGLENVHLYPAGPKGIILYLMCYETTANGDMLVIAGTAIPQLDGSFVAHLEFLPDQCTGRFAGATGVIDTIRAFPGGAVFEGTITTVGGK